MYIYRSNLICPDLRACFPYAKPFTVNYDHEILRDEDDTLPTPGYISHDEAAILYSVAQRVGGDWLEIGSHMGWSGAHILAAEVGSLMMIEPRLRQRWFFNRWYGNMELLRKYCGNVGIIQPYAARSNQYSECGDKDLFDGGFIDGDHGTPCPENDAQLLLARLKPKGAIVFHDFGGPVKTAVEYLMANGMSCRVYDTPQMVAVCWRGDFDPPYHTSDPAHRDAFAWRRTSMDFDFSRCL